MQKLACVREDGGELRSLCGRGLDARREFFVVRTREQLCVATGLEYVCSGCAEEIRAMQRRAIA